MLQCFYSPEILKNGSSPRISKSAINISPVFQSKSPQGRIIRSVTTRVTDNVTDTVTDHFDERELQVLKLLPEDPVYTSFVLAEKLSLIRKAIALRLKSLEEKGLIERIGSDRKGYWNIK